jgi:hypothetical protein
LKRNSIALAVLGAFLLSGCAANQSRAAAPEREPDCSFRSAATCWTVAGRFPARRDETRDSTPEKILQEPPANLASGE